MDPASFLEPPSDSAALRCFVERFHVAIEGSPREVLSSAARAFARIPYENLSKIVKRDREGSARSAFRSPLEVLQDHLDSGAGGTCFSLTAALLHLLRALGFEAEPLLADRPYGPDTHCAVRVVLDGVPHLVDPGYLVVEPVPLVAPRVGESGQVRVETSFNEVLLTARDGGARVDLETVQGGSRVRRLAFRTLPADASQLVKAWEASFGWDMMRYPLLTRIRQRDGAQVYLQGTHLQVRTRSGVERRVVPIDSLPAVVEEELGVRSGLAREALEVLSRRGELRAGAFCR